MTDKEFDIDGFIKDKKSIAIGGHVDPDGDCLGSCGGLFYYIKKYYPEKEVTLYLADHLEVYDKYIEALKDAKEEYTGKEHDIVFLLDTSAVERIGVIKDLFLASEETVCIDHHISNSGLAKYDHIEPDTGSASEVLYNLLPKDRIDRQIAICLYMGMISDTGVFQYQNTTPETLEAAAFLVSKGIDFSSVIEESFYQRTYKQSRIIGDVLNNAKLYLDGKLIVGTFPLSKCAEYEPVKKDMGSVISQLRLTEGCEMAFFAYELQENNVKVSLRSNGKARCHFIAQKLGGGGHEKAAGANVLMPFDDVIEMTVGLIEQELDEISGENDL